MGCFSFICKKCGKPINSDSFSGENVRLSLLKNGKIIEEMQGQYNSYGRVFDKKMNSAEWSIDWDDVCDLMFDKKNNTGMSAIHVECIPPNYIPTEKSSGDPNQGWGEYETRHTGDCEFYHKIME